jgi:hypothetical protein
MHCFFKTEKFKKNKKKIRPGAVGFSKPDPTLGLIKQRPMHEPLLLFFLSLI